MSETPDFQSEMQATVRIQGTLLFHDKDGNVVQTVEIDGAVPIDLIETKEEA